VKAVKRYTLVEASEEAGVRKEFVVHCLRAHWVRPAHAPDAELDELDLARLRLIATLQEDLGVNDESVPIILHLLDQLYS
jgi:chaperone modulatory protein CbpM